MLLIEKIQAAAFSPAEQTVIDYLLVQKTAIETLTIQEIATATFVHPSTFIRIAKKLGFSGWLEFKAAFLEEQRYLTSHFETIDANLPFTDQDNPLTIAQKMASLEQVTIQDTLSLLKQEELQQAADLLNVAKEIKIFTSNANLFIAQDFALKLRRIKKRVRIAETIGEHMYEAETCDQDTCVLLISYTGENSALRQILTTLKQHQSTIIGLTSIGENSIAQASDCHLRMTTRERLYSKIGNFTTSTSIYFLLDTLYATLFAKNYHENLAHLIRIGEAFDHRQTTAPVMIEPPRQQNPLLPHESKKSAHRP